MSSIETFSGAVRKAICTPGLAVVMPMVKWTPFAFSVATASLMSVTVRPKWSRAQIRRGRRAFRRLSRHGLGDENLLAAQVEVDAR